MKVVNKFQHSRISTKLILFFTGMLVIQSLISILSLYVVITRSNISNLHRELENSLIGTNQYFNSLIKDMEVKADLFAGQQKIIDYTEFGLFNLLRTELTVLSQSLSIESIGIYTNDSAKKAVIMINDDLQQFNELPNYISQAYFDEKLSIIAHNQNELRLFVCAPIKRDDLQIGIIILGKKINPGFISSIEQITSTPTMYLHDSNLIHSSIISSQEVFKLITANIIDLNNGTTLKNNPYIIRSKKFYSPLSNPGMFINIIDFSESLTVIYQYGAISVLITLAIFITAVIFAVRFYNLTILKPIKKLLKGISIISSGNFSKPYPNPGLDEFGKVAKAFNDMCRNLTRRDAELDKLSNYNSLILNNIPSGVITINRVQKITSINPAAQKLLSDYPEIIQNKSLDEISGQRPQFKEIIPLIKKSLLDKEYVYSKEILLEAGTQKILSLSTAPLFSGEQENIGIIAIIYDISELKRMEEQLNTSTKLAALGEMAAGVAHQVKNPLTVIRISMQMLQENFKLKEKQEEFQELVQFVLDEINSLDLFVGNFLDFSNIQPKKQNWHSLSELVEYSISHLPLDQYREISIQYKMEKLNQKIFCDKSLIIQALSNIILNAIQSCGDNGIVKIYSTDNYDTISLTIEDNGNGMTEQVKNKMFNPFFTTKDSGTGLGLSLVHRIIENHGGTIEVISSENSGCKFIIKFGEINV